ncbi:MAG TPA: cytochrome c biogenesis protein CcdA [Deltaproteobacteria bacterium]|nr:cytochrome c biogenesis protein CcdA [Deltaproteobacteria bacterium]HNS91070.1 cytochrome c biogenesis protein CcdA [Deltaproteobacteria bacterium]HOD72154.1 cytochrome c biogenesis protein CcdA [Deltaproteobacteria bacterium]HPA76487.1 cytochrome c biogenesis protein CcdA [Deltaproteobacteria bacterium]
MLESVYLTINSWLVGSTMYALVGSFLWGMVSVMLSPCHLASIPLIVAYVGGQNIQVNPRQAAAYSVAFSMGLFVSIALVGIACALLGRMLGDVGMFWEVLIGGILIWVALGMLGVESCSMSGGILTRLNFKGLFGALGLGLAYGILSGTCTFGFIAPILAIITVQAKIVTGIALILIFALGHCIPIVIAGSSTAAVKGLLENSSWQGASLVFRKGAGAVIILLGLYFITAPFVRAL